MSGMQAVQARMAEISAMMRSVAPPASKTSLGSSGAAGFEHILSGMVSQANGVGGSATSQLSSGSTGGALAGAGSLLGAQAARPAALRTPSGVAAYSDLFAAATQKYALPAGLLAAVAQVESGGNPNAVSSAGAVGLMQLMPGTARGLGVRDSRDPAQAVDGAARLLRDHLRSFGSVDLALAAYNAGPGAVRKHDGIPPYAETQNYVRKVNALLPRSVAS